jgi:virginiamycin B lyase
MSRYATFAFAATVAAMTTGRAPLHAQTAPALSGEVTSAEEGAMEGVVVSARKDGSNITVSVVTNEQGRYSFPADRLGAGHYAISIRAAGYDLAGLGAADLAGGTPATLDLKLRKTSNLSLQLTNAEWLLSVPGSENDKMQLLNCVSCHTLQRVVRSTHSADEFVQLIARMNGYAQVSQPVKPQRRVDQARAANPERFRKMAEYLATINLSEVPRWEYPLKTLPRVKGRGTHVIITEYDLPRPTIEPHDVVFANGYAWYTNFGEEYIGRLDPKTGQQKEFPLPEFKKGFPTGSLDLEMDPKDGSMWFGMMYQGALAKFDPKTELFQFFPVAKDQNKDDTQLNMVTLQYGVDGKMWTNNAGPGTIMRLDLASGKYETFDPLTALPGGKAGKSIYDIAADSHDNLFMTEYQNNYIARLDAKTGKVTSYQVPTPLSRNRRGHMDDQDRLWFAEYRGNKVAMFDTRAEKFSEWPLPTYTQPYDVTFDKNGELWTGGMFTDRVVRVDPKTGETIQYPLARDTNMRRMFVDSSTSPVTFWVGSNHGASIVKVEPQD